VGILNQIVGFKEVYYSGNKEEKFLDILEKKILALEAESIQHDFALLEL